MLNPFTLKFRLAEIEASYEKIQSVSYSTILKLQTIIYFFITLSLFIYDIKNDISSETTKIRGITYLFTYGIIFFILCKYRINANKIAISLNLISTILLGETIKVLIETERKDLLEMNISYHFFLFYSYALFQSVYFQTYSWIVSFFSISFNFIYYACILDILKFQKFFLIYICVGLMMVIFSYYTEKIRRNNFSQEFQKNQIYEHYKYVLIKLSSNIKIWMKRKNVSNIINYDINLINDFAKNKFGLIDFKSLEIFLQELEIENQDILKKNLMNLNNIIQEKEQDINFNFLNFKNVSQYSKYILSKPIKINENEPPILLTLEAHKIGEISHKFTINFLFYCWKNEVFMLLTINDFFLEEKIQELLELDRYKDQVLANVTHDIRTPLNGMLFLINEVKESESGKIKNSMRIAEIEGKFLMNLTNDILDYSSSKMNKLKLNINIFDLKNCIEEIFIMFEEKAKRSGISLILDYPNENIIIKSDENRLKQVLINLIGNSIKFTTKGYVKLKVSEIFNLIQFDIYDTGIGISKIQIEKLFLPFSTFNTGGLNKNGIGLGLLISKKIIGKLGVSNENIIIKSVVGEGSHFSFKIFKILENEECSIIFEKGSLNKSNEFFEQKINRDIKNSPSDDFPFCTNQNLMEHEKEKYIDATITTNLIDKKKDLIELRIKINILLCKQNTLIHILLVDDNFLNILVIQTYLNEIKSDKIKIDTAVNGKIAFDKFELQNKSISNNPYSHIIMDCEMPIMNGFEASKNINELINTNYKQCKIIGYSANNNENEIKKCMDSGMIDFISKPCSIFNFYHLLLRNLKV